MRGHCTSNPGAGTFFISIRMRNGCSEEFLLTLQLVLSVCPRCLLSLNLNTAPTQPPFSVPAPATVAPASLAFIAEAADRRIRTLLDAELIRWTKVDPDLAAPLSSLRDLVLAGGKRLRPAFCHWAFVGAGGDPSDSRVVDAGAGLEMLHTFALVHDDIMDNSSTRRGMDAVHIQFSDEHRRQGWQSEGRRFGEGVAILVGDMAFVYADQLLEGANPEAIRVFTELRVEVNIGQYLDLVGTVRGRPTLETARRICQYKSGKYTIERPLHLGVALMGASAFRKFECALSAFGLPLGEAFQLKDDLLGTLGDNTVIGKPVGDDLREGKPTALVARAIAAATPAQLAILDGIGSPDLSNDQITAIQQILVDTGAATAVSNDIDLLRDEALAAIATSALLPEAVSALSELAHYVTDRDR
jgi:geranylgeranyl diphosphate synthase, type I